MLLVLPADFLQGELICLGDKRCTGDTSGHEERKDFQDMGQECLRTGLASDIDHLGESDLSNDGTELA
jgi:hypothetical protein